MKIANVRVYGLEESIIASGYPKRTEELTEEEFSKLAVEIKKNIDSGNMGSNHINRFIKLGSTPLGEGHACALKGVIVQYDLTMNHVMMPQFMRYHFHDIVSSIGLLQ